MVEFILQIKPKTEKYNLMLSQLKAAQKKATKEEGCLSYVIFISDNGNILLHEKWQSQECLDVHLSLDYLSELKRSMTENLVADFDKFSIHED